MKNKISMQLTGKVYLTFKTRRYEIYKALAEYIDNSTQSYFDHIKEINEPLSVDINYNKNKIEIIDNAYGMDVADLISALKLGGEVKRNSGRHQFGMGMKVASVWFSDNWVITTKKLGDKKAYRVNIRMDDLVNDVDPVLETITADKNDHYTKIELLDLDKRRIAGKAAKKLKEVLGTVYKRDILSNNVKININGETVKASDFYFYNHETLGELKKDVDFNFEYLGQTYNVKGYIGIRTKGSTSETSGGFSLYDNDRVIMPNWRDSEIFKQTNSYTYQRLIGELDLNGFDVTSDKEDFDWHNGLREEFIDNLKQHTDEFSKLAEKIRTRLEPDTAKDKMTINKIGNKIAQDKDFVFQAKEIEERVDKQQDKMETQYKFPPKTVTLNNVKFRVSVELQSGGKDFIKIEREKNNIFLFINRDHKFLTPKLSNPEELENYINAFMYQALAMYYTEETYPMIQNGKTYLKTDTFWRLFNKLLLEAGTNE